MNIIQIQDRLKGLPEDALVNYVKEPMGEVPIYLALGELQRRKDMKERFQASQADKPSVAEQLVAETQPMGIASMMGPQKMMPVTQGVGAPQPTPEIDPRQMAASGIAANPVSNVGGPAMMAEGGIVGYQTGGSTGYSDEFIKMLEDQAKGIYPTSDFEYGLNPSTQMKGYAGDAAGSFQNTIFGRKQFYPFGTEPGLGGMYSGAGRKKATEEDIAAGKEIDKLDLSQPFYGTPVPEKILKNRENDKKKTDDKTEDKTDDKTNGKKDDVITDLSADDKVRADLARIKNLFPEDKDTIDLRERLADREDRALNMALIRGGLGMAAGQSANFLDNLAAGAMSGVESYAKTQEDILEAQRELAKQKRAEDLALLGKALDMEEGTLDRESREKVAKIMSSPNSGKLLNAILKDQDMKTIRSRLTILEGTPENERTDKVKKQIDILKAQERARLQYLIQLNAGNISGLTSSGTVDTSGLTQRQKELLDYHSGK